MSRDPSNSASRLGKWAAVVAVMFVCVAAARVQPADSAGSGPIGRIDFAALDLPPANVEIDLTEGMFGDLFGLGGAALAGVSESLTQAAAADRDSDLAKKAVEQIDAAQEIIQLAKGLVEEVRVRVYEDFPRETGQVAGIAAHLDEQLLADNWDNAVKVRDNDESVRVSIMREAGAIRGVFVFVVDGDDVVLVNLVCDVSPENIKKLTSMAVKIGIENGLQRMIENELRKVL